MPSSLYVPLRGVAFSRGPLPKLAAHARLRQRPHLHLRAIAHVTHADIACREHARAHAPPSLAAPAQATLFALPVPRRRPTRSSPPGRAPAPPRPASPSRQPRGRGSTPLRPAGPARASVRSQRRWRRSALRACLVQHQVVGCGREGQGAAVGHLEAQPRARGCVAEPHVLHRRRGVVHAGHVLRPAAGERDSGSERAPSWWASRRVDSAAAHRHARVVQLLRQRRVAAAQVQHAAGRAQQRLHHGRQRFPVLVPVKQSAARARVPLVPEVLVTVRLRQRRAPENHARRIALARGEAFLRASSLDMSAWRSGLASSAARNNAVTEGQTEDDRRSARNAFL